ncbi:MAG: methyl-accepting chemotaxis protein [Spirochaetales bacterium]|nr:methyl-accepting chemotaxis protein [Spirochaetales bacterium]
MTNKKQRTFALPLILLLMAELILAFSAQAFFIIRILRVEIKNTQETDYTFMADSLADLMNSELEGNEKLVLGYAENLAYALGRGPSEDPADWEDFCNATLENLKGSNSYFPTTFLLDEEGTVLFCTDQVAVGKNLKNREYFKILKEGNLPVYTTPTPINSTSTGESIIVHAASVKEKGQIKYIIGTTMDIALYGEEHLLQRELGETGYSYILDNQGTILIHPAQEYLFTSALEISPFFEEMINNKAPTHYGQYTLNGVSRRAASVRMDSTGWYAGIAMDIKESTQVISSIRKLFVLSNAILILTTTLLVAIFIRRKLIRNVKVLESLVNQASEGVLTERGRVNGRDEIAGMTERINSFLDTLKQFFSGLNDSLGDLDGTGTDLAANMEETAAALYQIRKNVENSLNQIEKQEESVSTTASTVEETTQNIMSLDRNIERQNQNITQGSAAVEEMVAQIKNVSASTDEADQIMENLALTSRTGRQTLESVSSKIIEISEKSQELEKANSLISGIAARTNLLAMNAAIEAAHAGDAGRGFAVVSDEIRKLAEQSTTQSGQVSQTIEEIKGMMAAIVSGSEESNRSFDEIRQQIESMNRITGEIKSSMEEQVSGGTDVLQSLDALKNAGLEVRAGSEEMTQGNQIILNAIQELTQISSEVALAMKEIDSGMEEINKAAEAVALLSVDNKTSIEKVRTEASRYKI